MKTHFHHFFFIAFFLPFITTAQTISTVAGNGTAGYSGDGGIATAAKIFKPHAVAVDASGNIYIADTYNNRIRKVSTSGTITTICGNSGEGFSGDGGPAGLAELDQPNGICIDAIGNIYILDGNNQRVRKIDTSGNINTIVGDGTAGYIGDGGPATSAEINFATAIAIDASGTLYIADADNNVIRKVDASGTITTFAGDGGFGYSGEGGAATSASIGFPYGVAVDGSGNVYTELYFDERILKIDGSGIITTIGGNGTEGFSGDGGPATSAEFDSPWGLAADASGNVYVSDNNNNRIRKIDVSGNVNTIAGTGTAGFTGDGGTPTSAELNFPNGVALDASGNVYIVDYANQRIRMVGSPLDHAPYFTGGHAQTLTVCENAPATSINSLLAAGDIDTGQTETWSVSMTATHGTASASYTTTSTGGTLTPSGLTYTPATGYSGTDSFTVTISDGTSSDYTTIYVAILPLPDAGTITGTTTTICAGATTTLSDASPGGVWSAANDNATVSGGVVSGVAGGADTIVYTVSNSCGTDSATYIITILPAADAGSITGATDSLCPGDTLSLSDAAPGGTWGTSAASVATVSVGGVVTAVSAGPDTITYTVSGSCGAAHASFPLVVRSASECASLVSAVTGSPAGITISPNPNAGNFALLINSPFTEQVQITITNMLGQEVKELFVNTNIVAKVALSQPAGVYFISANSDHIGWSGRLVVQNR